MGYLQDVKKYQFCALLHCSVQLESHRRVTFYKKGQPVRYKMKAKYPPKVNVWAGISSRGATNVVIFMGTLTATRYGDILEAALIPFSQMNIDSNKITTPSTLADMRRIISRKKK
jgi:hypothetical protein